MATRQTIAIEFERKIRIAKICQALESFPPDIRKAWITIILWYGRTKRED